MSLTAFPYLAIMVYAKYTNMPGQFVTMQLWKNEETLILKIPHSHLKRGSESFEYILQNILNKKKLRKSQKTIE